MAQRLLLPLLFPLLGAQAAAQTLPVRGDFRTDLSKRSIELSELTGGGPPQGGIPAAMDPKFDAVAEAAQWLEDDLEVLVTYCPLCNSAMIFDRLLDGKTYTFGVSGMLRNSDMVMYGHQTDSLWQQLTGEAIVGTCPDKNLRLVSSQVTHFGAVRSQFPQAKRC